MRMETAFWSSPTGLILLYLLAINLIGFIMMGIDKYKARHDRWRIPEKTLMLIALLGGSVGAWVGMYTFHHKTNHKLFTIGVPAILFLELAIFIYFRFIR